MRVKDIQKIAKSMGIKPSQKKKKDLIHEIQLKEGNTDCYNGEIVGCRELCLWSDCKSNVLDKF